MTRGRNTDLCSGSYRLLTFNLGTVPSRHQKCPECRKVVKLRRLRYVAGFPFGTIPRHNCAHKAAVRSSAEKKGSAELS